MRSPYRRREDVEHLSVTPPPSQGFGPAADVPPADRSDAGVMTVALMTNALRDLSLPDMLGWLSASVPGITGVEIGTGGYAPAPHCDLRRSLDDRAHRQGWCERLRHHGVNLVAFNVSGNPLSPDPEIAKEHDRDLRDTIRLAAELGVDRIVAMSGCPGPGPEVARAPHFAAGGWLPDFRQIADWQWEARVLPYWAELSEFARAEHPEVAICLELHPGACVFNVPTYRAIQPCGDNLKINLDPSHFFWEGMDPIAVIRECQTDIAFVHAKDTKINASVMALVGALDPRIPGDPDESPWNFVAVGAGHDAAWWGGFVAELAAVGYSGALSVEIGYPFVEARRGIVDAAAILRYGLDQLASI
jgi:sugar phosphate isomerase/epimerase